MKIFNNFSSNEKGMTGLETAIILIAFVTIAAVFGYAVLSAGLFSAEQGKETIYEGLAEAKSNLQLAGSVIGKSTDTTNLDTILFNVKNAAGGDPINLTPCDGTPTATNKCVINFTTTGTYLSNIQWASDASDNLLEAGEQCQITIDLTDLGDGKALSDNLTANTAFNIQIKPATGAVITIQRTLPGALDKVMDLH
ncbi:MAG: hypothetical protein PHO26_06530 [Dehalococcoidia bacterium]|nr:hypothetical protein [Dehalococcoidia bacterium]MDD5493414.1 hypothetical protein [Dehalococcoidia bacterium]